MRIIGNIPYPDIHITVFAMNEKYVIKMEAGPMEQTYKISMDTVAGLDGIQKFLDESFMKKVLQRFNEMFLDLQEAKKRIA
jgi:hypothetical protein